VRIFKDIGLLNINRHGADCGFHNVAFSNLSFPDERL
jgi:hypothetical protein